jgi:hypothetical protein
MSIWDSVFGASSLPSSPTSQQTSTSSIQPWAQPYISNYLDRAQALVNTATPTALQNQSYIGAANLSVPGAFGTAEALATQAGQGQLASAPIAYGYGTEGSQYGKQGAGLGIAGGSLYGGMGANYGMTAGQNYAQQATSPEAMQAYMNPYVQQSLKPQLELLNQQQMLGAQGIAAKAVGQGAFGGNRATLAQGLNAQNYDLARQQAIAQGYNTAFGQAQQAQQFGANLGLQGALGGAGVGLQGVGTQLAGTGQGMQGAQVGLQGVSGAQAGYGGATNAASALGNIGAQQAAAQLGILGIQNQFGTQQQNMPYQNLQFAQGMMSGLPISYTTQQGYQAPPNAISQVAGLGQAGLGSYLAYKAFGGAAGGLPKDFKQVQSYADGGAVDSYLENMPTAGYLGLTPVDENYPIADDYMRDSLMPQSYDSGIAGLAPAMMRANPQATDLANIRLNQLLGNAG